MGSLGLEAIQYGKVSLIRPKQYLCVHPLNFDIWHSVMPLSEERTEKCDLEEKLECN